MYKMKTCPYYQSYCSELPICIQLKKEMHCTVGYLYCQIFPKFTNYNMHQIENLFHLSNFLFQTLNMNVSEENA